MQYLGLLSQLLLADDATREVESAGQVQCLVTEFGRVCKGRKVEVNEEKSEVIAEQNVLNIRNDLNKMTLFEYVLHFSKIRVLHLHP